MINWNYVCCVSVARMASLSNQKDQQELCFILWIKTE